MYLGTRISITNADIYYVSRLFLEKKDILHIADDVIMEM